MMNNDKKVVVFDFDGTIVDSMGNFADIATDVIHTHYGTDTTTARQQYIQTSGIPFFQQLEVVYPGDSRNKTASDDYESRKALTYLDKQPFADIAPAVEMLQERGIKVVISSNNFQDLVDQLADRTGIPFDLVLGFRENFDKGEPHFIYIRNHFKCAYDDMLFVGDSLHDLRRAKELGLDFVGRTGTFTAQQFYDEDPFAVVVDEFVEMAQYIAQRETLRAGLPKSWDFLLTSNRGRQ